MGAEARMLARIEMLETLAKGEPVHDLRFDRLQAEWDQLQARVRDLEAEVAATRRVVNALDEQIVTALQRERAVYAEYALALAAEPSVNEFPRGFFVYILRDTDGEAVYVGQSRNLLARLGQHALDPTKARVATYSVLRCESHAHMCATEEALIRQLRPPLNIVHNF